MPLLLFFKILIIGAIFGAVFMFISALTEPSKKLQVGGDSRPNKLLVIFRFIVKLVIFMLILIFPFFLLKLIA